MKSSPTQSIALRLSTVSELLSLLKASGRWWLNPMARALLATVVLLGAVTANEYIAPFVYTVF